MKLSSSLFFFFLNYERILQVDSLWRRSIDVILLLVIFLSDPTIRCTCYSAPWILCSALTAVALAQYCPMKKNTAAKRLYTVGIGGHRTFLSEEKLFLGSREPIRVNACKKQRLRRLVLRQA